MSRIPDLGEKFGKLPEVLAQYENELDGVEENLRLKGKLVDHANRENPTWLHYYDSRRVELSILMKFFEGQLDRVRGKLFKNLTVTSQKDLSDRAKDKYIDNEKEYLDMLEVSLEVREVLGKYESVVKAYEARGYALKNITDIRVSALENAVI